MMPVPDFRRQTLVKFNFENARVWEFRALSDTMWVGSKIWPGESILLTGIAGP
jgi:hypothetical protein